MDYDPNFSVSLVKDTNPDEPKESEMHGANISSNWIGTTKDCQALWDTLQAQGQLFKILDTLTAKTGDLVGRLQNRTATEEDGVTALGLLSQLGIMFIDVETKQDGSKERRFSFLTDVESKPQLNVSANLQLAETAASEPDTSQSVTAWEETGDANGNQDDTLKPASGENDLAASSNSTEVTPLAPVTYICEWCEEDQGTAVMLDLHLLQYCQILLKPYKKPMPCPSCGSQFRKLARFCSHLLNEHSWKREDAEQLLRKLRDELGMKPSNKNKNDLDEKENGASSNLSECETTVTSTKVIMVCEVCKKKFGTRIKLRSHLMDTHGFSRQKAAGSVHKSIRSAHTTAENTVKSDGIQKRGLISLYCCSDCNISQLDRLMFVNHMTSQHGLLLSKAQKEANKQYKEMNAKFGCDLCPCKYSDRYVLLKHFVGIHKIPKNKAHTKVIGMYPSKKGQKLKEVPSSRSKRHVERMTDSQSNDTDTDIEEVSATKNAQRILRSRSKQKGVTCLATRRQSKRVVKEAKRNPKVSEAQEVEQGSSNEDEDKRRDVSDIEDESTDLQDDDYDPAKSEEIKKTRSKRLKSSPKKKVSQNTSPKRTGHFLENDEPVEIARSVTSQEKALKDSQNDQEGQDCVGKGHKNGEDALQLRSERDSEKLHSTEKPPAKRRGRRPGSKAERPGKHKCPHCEKTFQYASYAKIHIAGVHKETPNYQCSTCQKTFNFRSTFLRHLNCHKNEELGICFFCDSCGKCFFDKYTLDVHRKTHITEKPFNCDYCGKGFDHQSVLLRHRNTHTKEIQYKCSHCDRVFYRKSGLKYHLKALHEKTRDYVCTLCGGAFPCKSTLIAHGLTHSEHRAFQCDICGIRVKTKGNLKEHVRCVHTDKRAFKCNICNKAFNRSHRLTLHMMMHRDERPHMCHICNKAFRTRTNLRVHIKWHRDQRDFQCEQCGKTFLIPGNLDRHMQTHKNGKVGRRRNNKKLTAPSPESKTATADPNQKPVAVESPLQTVQNLVASGGFESDLPTLASIAQHLSTINIPVFQVPHTSSHVSIPVSIPADSTLTGTTIPSEASQALAVFSHAHQQQLQEHDPPVTQAVQGSYEQIPVQLTIS